MMEFIVAAVDQEYAAAAELFKAYADSLDIDLSFQNFNSEIAGIKLVYSPGEGGILLCRYQGEFVACAALRKIDSQTAELKRMFVQHAFQQQGIGGMLLEKIIARAKTRHYSAIRLDTLCYMEAAIKLYKRYGFYEIPAYYNNPIREAVYFELQLQ